MGFKGEKASLNQYSSMYEYCQEHVVPDMMKIVRQENRDREDKLKETYKYIPTENNEVPVISFDGGMANIFEGLKETCIIKVAGGCGSEWKEHFIDYLGAEFVHVNTGIVSWPQGINKTAEEVVRDHLKRLFALAPMKHVQEEGQKHNLDIYEEVKTFFNNNRAAAENMKDSFRELLEWAMILHFHSMQKDNKKIDQSSDLPYLIVKDGSVFPRILTVSFGFSKLIREVLDSGKFYVIGAVKASRFMSPNNPASAQVFKYCATVPSHSFIKIPEELELIGDGDAKNKPFERFFLSLFGGKSCFEIQVPKKLAQNEAMKTKILDVMRAQVSFMYGGSVRANSQAHIQASLSMAESKMLANKLKAEMYHTAQAEEQKKKDLGIKDIK